MAESDGVALASCVWLSFREFGIRFTYGSLIKELLGYVLGVLTMVHPILAHSVPSGGRSLAMLRSVTSNDCQTSQSRTHESGSLAQSVPAQYNTCRPGHECHLERMGRCKSSRLF